MPLRIGLECRAIDDRELGNKCVEFRALRTAQQVADEEIVPCQFADHPHVKPMFCVSTAIKVLHEVLATLHVFQHVSMQAIEGVRRHWRVVFPPDVILDRRRADDELVFG